MGEDWEAEQPICREGTRGADGPSQVPKSAPEGPGMSRGDRLAPRAGGTKGLGAWLRSRQHIEIARLITSTDSW